MNNYLYRFSRFSVYEEYKWIKKQAKLISPGSRVLDVGAGPCRFRHLFTHCIYQTQDYCQHIGSTHGPLAEGDSWKHGDIDYVCDAISIPVPSASFDVVLGSQVLEHLPEPILVIKEISRILRAGGKLILTAPLGSGLHQEPDHFYGGFTPYWYLRFLSEVGFGNIEIVPNGGFFKHYGQESQRFSAYIDPRRIFGINKYLLLPLWLFSIPYFRILMPLLCHFLDNLDLHKGFTVGYHVSAIKRCM